MTNRPQEFVPQSQRKAEQIVTKESDVFTNKQKSEFRVLNLVENTRQLLTEEIIHPMYPSEVLSRITEETSNDFISYSLEEAFLPWPLNMIHIVPDWVILTVLGVIGLLLIRVFFDPVMAG